MCTVSIVPTRSGVRLISNRDERRSRPQAMPPRVHKAGRRRALFPIDPVGGGTWIGANDGGLLMALLNRSAAARADNAALAVRSRGSIIPQLLSHDTLLAAVDAAAALSPEDFDPFCLVIMQRLALGVVASDGRRMSRTFLNISQPIVWSSSSLGDHVVERPRAALFDDLVREAPPDAWRVQQTRYHRHQWKRHPEISVVMARSDAATVSRTVVGVEQERVTMTYQPLGDTRLVVEHQLQRVA